uniref:Transmembrane protein n=1 Tax=Schistosoma curassoni TaxID=6186 RepID=A0A183L3H3_9TREM
LIFLIEFIDVVLKKCFGLTDTDESIVSIPNHVSPKVSVYGPYSSDDQDKAEVNGSTDNPVNVVHDGYSTTVEVPLFVRQMEDRTRIVSSGGLARRRPPTKIVVSLINFKIITVLYFNKRISLNDNKSYITCVHTSVDVCILTPSVRFLT